MKLIIGIIIALIIIGIAYWYFFISPSAMSSGTEGSLCNGGQGHIINGKCVPLTATSATIPCGGKLNPC